MSLFVAPGRAAPARSPAGAALTLSGRPTRRAGWRAALAWPDALVLLAAGVAAAATLQQWDPWPLRGPAGLLLVWFAPGFALLRAVGSDDGPGVLRTVLGVPLSCCLTILTGIALDHSPAGLDGTAYVLVLAALTAALLAGGALRRAAGAPVRAARVVALAPAAAGGSAGGRRLVAGVLGLAGLVCAVAWAVAGFAAAVHTVPPPFTTLALETAGSAAGPEAAPPVAVTVQNDEGRPLRYRVEVRRGDETVARWDGVGLASGETWRAALPAAGGGYEVLLFREGDETPYRRLLLHGQAPPAPAGEG